MRIFIFLKLMLLKTDQGKTEEWLLRASVDILCFEYLSLSNIWRTLMQIFGCRFIKSSQQHILKWTQHSCVQAVSNEIPILVNISFNANYLQISKFQYFMKHWSLNVTSGCDARAHIAQIWAKGGGAGLGSHHNLHGTLTLVSSPCFHLYPLV